MCDRLHKNYDHIYRMLFAMSCKELIYKGDDVRVQVIVRDQYGALVDITGAQEITWQVALNNKATPLLTKTLSSGQIQLGNESTFFFDLTDTETATLPEGRLYQEAELINGQGLKYTVLSETLLVRPALIN